MAIVIGCDFHSRLQLLIIYGRIAIVPATLGYGKRGLYPPEIHGQPRFVINPNVVLVYDLDVLLSGAGDRARGVRPATAR